MSRPRQSPTLRKAIVKHRRAAYQEGILLAASNVFGRLGFIETKMSEVAAEAGVSVGTLYNYFASKDALIAALIEQQHEVFREHVAPAEGVKDPLERIGKLVDLSFRFIDERKELIAMAVRAGVFQAHMAAELSGDVEAPGHVLLQQLYEEALAEAAQAGTLRTDLPVTQLAKVLQAIVNGLVQDWVRTEGAQPLVAQSALVLEVFLKGAQPR